MTSGYIIIRCVIKYDLCGASRATMALQVKEKWSLVFPFWPDIYAKRLVKNHAALVCHVQHPAERFRPGNSSKAGCESLAG